MEVPPLTLLRAIFPFFSKNYFYLVKFGPFYRNRQKAAISKTSESFRRFYI